MTSNVPHASGVIRDHANSSGDPLWFAAGTEYVYALIVLSLTVILLYDLATPLGVAVWVFYCMSVAMAFLVWHPVVPLIVAGVATTFMVLGFFASPPGIDTTLSFQNRFFGTATCWMLGATGFVFIRGRLALRRQEWTRAAQIGLSTSTAGDLPVPELCDRILRFLAEYLGAKAAAMFVEDGDSYRRSATYAVPRTAAIPETVEEGDGLVGQALKDNRAFVVDRVPPGYLAVGSSLGESSPTSLMIAPARVNGSVNAIIELGFTEPISASYIELHDRVAEAIGISVRSAKYRARLKELLEETRLQGEELKTQSDELRAANEELEQQSRTLEASQRRLEQQQGELEHTNRLLEEQTLSLEERRDELERSQEALKAQARDLERISRYKTEFLANMSHELRTPLNSALIMARLLADNRNGNLSADEIKYAETIEAAGNDLLSLINDILDLSKIEAGRVEVRAEDVSIPRVMEKLTRVFEPMARERKIAFRAHIDETAPASLETDGQRLEQILKNFLSNAVKFTDSGHVAIEVTPRGADHVAFAVQDTGIGIAPEHHEFIFEAFRQADGTTNRRHGGTGLGLSISRQLSHLLGGDIELVSDGGKGSLFTLVLPRRYDPALARSERHQPGPLPSPATGNGPPGPATRAPSHAVKPHVRQCEDDRDRLTGDSRVILVVEDDPRFARILYDVAHEQGFQCLIAETAEDGVADARQFLPHAIVLDVGLPDHSGLSVLDRLKHNINTRHIPVHVVSMHDYTQTALSWGAVGYILKPVKREALVRALQGFEERLNRKVRRVLVVEDDFKQLESVRALLASSHIETTAAQTADECLRALDAATFDCMVLDLSLPDVSGFDLLQRLSEDENRAFPPVIIYTGRDLSPDEELRLRRYSKSIIIKGARSPERLLDEVTLFLHQVVSDLPIEHQNMVAKAVNRDGLLEGKRILVVEDDVRNVYALTSILETQGVHVEIARNGREALETLESLRNAGTRVDLILMDIMMPEMDGLAATRAIRERPEFRDTPVIVLTAKAMADDHIQCIAAGANDYMAKPLDVEKLLSLVRVWMPK